jgi:hypothetical protein
MEIAQTQQYKDTSPPQREEKTRSWLRAMGTILPCTLCPVSTK